MAAWEGEGGARSCTTAGRPRSAEGSWCGPEDLHLACWPGCEWQVAGERGGCQRMAGLGLPRWCCRDSGRSWRPGRAGAPVGGGPRVSTQPCRGRGEGGVQMPGHRQRGGGSQKSGWGRLGRLGEPPGSCPAGRRHLRGLCSWGCLWGMPAPSCSAVEGPAPQ